MLAVVSVIDDRSHWNLGRELSDSAGVVLMEMCQQNEINFRNCRISSRCDDTVCIAAIVAWPARVDEQRLPARCNKQRGLAALNIDEIDLKTVPSLTRWSCPGHRQQGETQKYAAQALGEPTAQFQLNSRCEKESISHNMSSQVKRNALTKILDSPSVFIQAFERPRRTKSC